MNLNSNIDSVLSLSDGISGTIGSLTIDPDYERDTTGIPIDTLVADLTDQVDGDDDIGKTDLAL
jgi:hypothetical protein